MTFESLYIKSFGKLNGKKIAFQDGVNIIEGANESGKSTICAFIQFIFYGLPMKASDKMKYISWDTSIASGSMVVKENGVRYRIEREVICATNEEGKRIFREKCGIFNAESNTVCFKSRSPGEVFFGVSSSVFESTAYIRQTLSNSLETKTLGDEAENILFSGNERLNTSRALVKLDNTRAGLLQKNRTGGKIFDLEEKRNKIAGNLKDAQTCETDIISLEGSHRVLTEKSTHLKNRIGELQGEKEEYTRYRTKRTYLLCESEKEKLDETEKQLRMISNPIEHENIAIGESSYISSLEQKQNELSLAQSRLIDAKKELKAADDKISQMSEKLSVFAGLGEKDRGELVQNMENSQQKMGRCNTITLIFGICAVFSMILALIFRNNQAFPDLFKYLSVTACLLFATAAAYVFFMKKHDYAIEIENICKKFNCRSYDEVKELIKAASEDEAYMLALRTIRSEKKEKLTAAADELDTLSTQIISILQDANFRIFENAPVSLAKAIEKCRSVQEQIQALKIQAVEQRSNIESFENELSVHSEEYIAEAVAAEYDEKAMEAFDVHGKQKELDESNEKLESYVGRIHQIEVDLSALRAVSTDPTAIAEEMAILDHEIETLTKKWNAHVLAVEALRNASGKLREGISPKLAKSASKLFSSMTDGKHEIIGLDTDLALSFSEGNAMHEAAYLSAGTGDLAYICLRMALIEMLYKESIPPLIFDESFVRMDDKRMEGVLVRIQKYSQKNHQCLLFTCHSREKAAMQTIGTHHIVSL